MSPNPRGRVRFTNNEPDRGIRNLLYILVGLQIVQLVLVTAILVGNRRGIEPPSSPPPPQTRAERQGSAEPQAPVAPASEPSAAAETSPPAEVATLPIRVQVLNGCGVPGIARRAQEWLVRNGYDVRDVGNADRQDYQQSRVLDRGGNLSAARDLASALGIDERNVVKLSGAPSLKIDVSLILGHDYKRLAFAR